MKLILARHTTTDWNEAGRIQGQTDKSLNSIGKIEAQKLAQKLSALGIKLIISSDLKRARETAEIIKSVINVPLSFDKRLRECSFGRLEGLTREQTIEKYGNSLAKDWDDQSQFYDFRPYGGENQPDVLDRHMTVIESLKGKPEDIVLLVGHDRGMVTLIAKLGGKPVLGLGDYQIIEYS